MNITRQRQPSASFAPSQDSLRGAGGAGGGEGRSHIQRQERVAELVLARPFVAVKDLAGELDVSLMTIRLTAFDLVLSDDGIDDAGVRQLRDTRVPYEIVGQGYP